MAATAEIRPAAARLEREERGSSVLNVFDTGASALNVAAEGMANPAARPTPEPRAAAARGPPL
jgi:hypothetical protein